VNSMEVKNLSKRFDNFMAVKDINFTVGEGEVFGFLGPNGAGKTTTINMLTGLAKPTSGSITISGHKKHKKSAENYRNCSRREQSLR